MVIIYSFVHLMAADINCDKKQSCIYKYLNKILLQLNYQYSVIYNYNMLGTDYTIPSACFYSQMTVPCYLCLFGRYFSLFAIWKAIYLKLHVWWLSPILIFNDTLALTSQWHFIDFDIKGHQVMDSYVWPYICSMEAYIICV